MLTVYLQLLDSEEEKVTFENLYYTYRNYMYAIALNIVQNEDDAEDIVHQAFISLLKCIKGIDQVQSSKTKSLISIAVINKSRDFLRKRNDTSIVTLEEYSEMPDRAFTTETTNITEILMSMPEKTRHILLLRFDNGYSSKEIARLMDMSVDAVQKTIVRAKKHIKDSLGIL